jgi:hypothetical protein
VPTDDHAAPLTALLAAPPRPPSDRNLFSAADRWVEPFRSGACTRVDVASLPVGR